MSISKDAADEFKRIHKEKYDAELAGAGKLMSSRYLHDWTCCDMRVKS